MKISSLCLVLLLTVVGLLTACKNDEITKPITKITLSETSITLEPGETKSLSVIVEPSGVDNYAISWISSNNLVAEVNSSGVVTAYANGKCVITCSSMDGSSVRATCQVKVSSSSFCPTWLGFTYKTGSYPNYVQGKSGGIASVNAGDSLHITACQKERGRLINGTDYSWTVCYDTLDTKMNDDPSDDEIVHVQVSKYQHTNYDGYANGADDPVGHLLIPANAVKTSFKPDTVKFNAYYTYSGQGVMVETGNIVDNLSYNGRIVPQSSVAYGGAQGVFFFYVK